MKNSPTAKSGLSCRFLKKPLNPEFGSPMELCGKFFLEFEKSNGSKIQETKMYTISASTIIESLTFTATSTIDEREKGFYPGAFVVISGSAAPHPEITPDSIKAGE